MPEAVHLFGISLPLVIFFGNNYYQTSHIRWSDDFIYTSGVSTTIFPRAHRGCQQYQSELHWYFALLHPLWTSTRD